MPEQPSQSGPPPGEMPRRSFLRQSAVVASGLAALAASLAPLRELKDHTSVEQWLQKYYKELTPDEMARVLKRIETEVERQYGRRPRVSDLKPMNGVEFVYCLNLTRCIGCRKCEAACPFGAPQFNVELNIVQKCNMCIDELEVGRKPYCVSACMMRVLDIGPINELRDGTYETKAVGPNDTVVRQVKSMADPELTNPSIVFIAHPKGKVES